MGLGLDRHRPHAAKQLAEGRVARKTGAKDEVVGKEPDQPFEFGRPARHGRAHGEIASARVSQEKHLEGREQRYEKIGALAFAERADRLEQPPAQLRDLRRRPKSRLPRPPTACGQIEGGRHSLELALPVRELLLEALPAKEFRLHHGELAVLDRQRRERRWAPLDIGVVERAELAIEDLARSLVEGDSMRSDEKHVFFAGETQKRCSENRAPRQIERPLRFLFGEAQHFRLSDGLRMRAQVDDCQRIGRRGDDRLHESRVDRPKHAAQDFVALANRVQRAPKRLDVQPTPDAKGPRNVGPRLAGVDLVEKPETLLRVRQGRGTSCSVVATCDPLLLVRLSAGRIRLDGRRFAGFATRRSLIATPDSTRCRRSSSGPSPDGRWPERTCTEPRCPSNQPLRLAQAAYPA